MIDTNEKLRMRDLITAEHKHLLWRDETGDDFLLLKYGEIYRYGENTLRLYVWSRKMLLLLRQEGVVLNASSSCDGFDVVDVHRDNLPLLISLGAFKRRPDINGRWIKSRAQLLGHAIRPYRAKLDEKLAPEPA